MAEHAVAGGVVDLVRDATAGDQAAWDTLVARYAGLVWNVARAHRLDRSDAADVCQTVWLRLVEHLGELRQPEALPGWLATTARHESLRALRRGHRELPEEDPTDGLDDPLAAEPGPESLVLAEERRRLVVRALGTLGARCQVLLRALAYTPEASYAEVSNALGMPIGSIGPTRARCLRRLEEALARLGLRGADGGAP